MQALGGKAEWTPGVLQSISTVSSANQHSLFSELSQSAQPTQWAQPVRDPDSKQRRMTPKEQQPRLSSGLPIYTYIQPPHIWTSICIHIHTQEKEKKTGCWKILNELRLINSSPFDLPFLEYTYNLWSIPLRWAKSDLHRVVNKLWRCRSSSSPWNNLVIPQTDPNYHSK